MQSFFVSSTFRDMQAERDALHRIVMPRLREEARQYGEAVQFVDLRWGISTGDLDSDAGAARILDICLDEVKQCRPYMIVLVGDRYGWVPPTDLIRHASEASGYAAEDDGAISVTELEIRYSMWLAQGELDHFIFCLREPMDPARLSPEQQAVFLASDPEDRRRMDALREKLAAAPGATVLRYALSPDPETGTLSGCETFADRLSEAILTRLRPKWEARAARTWQEAQREEDRIIIEGHQATYVGRNEEMRSLLAALSGHQVVVVEGEGGSGKSAFLADLEKRSAPRMRTEMFCCGNSARCMSTLQLMRLMLWALGVPDEAAPDADIDPVALRNTFRRHMADYDGPRILLILDAIDQLTPDRALYESWFLPPRISRHIRLVISTTGAVSIHPGAIPIGQGVPAMTVFPLRAPDEKDLRAILISRFRADHKEVSAAVADRILANPCSRNMLGMELIVRRLVMLDSRDFAEIARLEQAMDGEAAINSHLLSVADGLRQDMNQLIMDYFMAAAKFLCPENYRIPLFYLCLIGMLQHGMSAGQFEQFNRFCREDPACGDIPEGHIFRNFWDPLLYAQTKRYMSGLLMTRSDGRVDLTHRLLREGILHFSANDALYPFLPYWLYSNPAEDPSRLENIISMGRHYHAIRSAETNGDPEQTAVWSNLMIFFPIRDAGNLADSRDEAEAAEGRRQRETLLRSILADLSGPDAESRMLQYARILEEGIVRTPMSPTWYVVVFFATDLTHALEQRGDAGRVLALPLLCRILDALHRVRKQLQADDSWSDHALSRFLFFHIRTLRLLAEAQESLHEEQIALDKKAILPAKDIYSRGIALAEELMARDPHDPWPVMRRAQLHAYMARIFQVQKSTTGRAERTAQMAVRDIREMLDIAQRGSETPPSSVRNVALELTAHIAETRAELHTKRLFGRKGELQACIELCREGWDAVMACGRKEDVAPESRIQCCTVMGQCLFRTGLGIKDPAKQKAAIQEAADMLGACYMQIHREQNDSEAMTGRMQESLGELAAEVGWLLLLGYVPAALAEKDFDRLRAARLITALDGSRIQAQPVLDIRSRWIQALATVTEALGISEEENTADRCIRLCALATEQIAALRRIAGEKPDLQNMNLMGVFGDNRVEILEQHIARLRTRAEKLQKSAKKS